MSNRILRGVDFLGAASLSRGALIAFAEPDNIGAILDLHERSAEASEDQQRQAKHDASAERKRIILTVMSDSSALVGRRVASITERAWYCDT